VKYSRALPRGYHIAKSLILRIYVSVHTTQVQRARSIDVYWSLKCKSVRSNDSFFVGVGVNRNDATQIVKSETT